MRLVHFEHIALQHGVVVIALHLDAMVGKDVPVVLDVLAQLLLAAVLQPGLEPCQHLSARQLHGRVGIAVCQGNVGGLTGLDTQADANNFGAHFIERGGFGVHRHQVGTLHNGEPALQGIPAQDGLVGHCSDAGLDHDCSLGRHIEQVRFTAGLGCTYRPRQALEAILFVKDKQGLKVHAATGQRRQGRQVVHPASQITVRLDGQQLAPQRQPVQRLPQVLANRARNGVGMGHHPGERAILLQPLGGGLGAYLGHAGYVVNSVAHQRLVVHHQLRRHAKFGLDPGHIAALAVHGVDDGDVAVDELRQILVAAADNHLDVLSGSGNGQRADHIVGLHAGHRQHLPAHQTHHFVNRLDLGAQIVRHGRAMRLVLGVERITKGGAAGVKNAGGKIGGKVLAQALQHIDHAANGTRGRAARVTRHSAQVRHGMKSAVQVTRTINQQQVLLCCLGVIHTPILPVLTPDRVVLQSGHAWCPHFLIHGGLHRSFDRTGPRPAA